MGTYTTKPLSAGAQALLARLGFPETFPSGCHPSLILETHLSVVFVGPVHTLKWKKPENFSFIDHRLLEVRRRSVRDEVELNRRHSTDIYLGIAEARKDSPKIYLHSDITKLDITESAEQADSEWGVWMKTLPTDQFLANQIETSTISVENLTRVAHRLAEFHMHQLADPIRNPRQPYSNVVLHHCTDNIEVLSKACADIPVYGENLLATLARLSTEMVSNIQTLLAERSQQGWIVDGHGDLRSDHISFATSPISFIDCIEFSREYREIDVLDELAFLAMDLRRRFRSDLARTLIESYRAIIPNSFSNQLFEFYLYYRASVRAKVEYLAWRQLSDSGVESPSIWLDPLRLSLSIARGFSGPRIIAIAGLMGTGKSTLAQALLSQIHATYLQADQVRREIFGESDRTSSYGSGLYSDKNRALVYQNITKNALNVAALGEIVIVDASFASAEYRHNLAAQCARYQIPLHFLLCTLPRDQTLARLDARSRQSNLLSDGRSELYDIQASKFDSFNASERAISHEINMSLPPSENIEGILSLIFSK